MYAVFQRRYSLRFNMFTDYSYLYRRGKLFRRVNIEFVEIWKVVRHKFNEFFVQVRDSQINLKGSQRVLAHGRQSL